MAGVSTAGAAGVCAGSDAAAVCLPQVVSASRSTAVSSAAACLRWVMGSGARDLLDSAGCQNVKGDWPVQASDRVEAILEAVGLRG